MISLLIPGEPATITAQQKGVNFKSRSFYTKVAVKAEKRRVKRCIQLWTGAEYVAHRKFFTPLIGPLHVSVKFVFPFTEEQAAKHADKLSDPRFEIHHGKRPDVDNSLKLILDTLTELKLWEDDSQIDDLNVHKRRGTDPRIAIAVRAIS
jgi:Holliday junction resolvase RusA-like endonuclease